MPDPYPACSAVIHAVSTRCPLVPPKLLCIRRSICRGSSPACTTSSYPRAPTDCMRTRAMCRAKIGYRSSCASISCSPGAAQLASSLSHSASTYPAASIDDVWKSIGSVWIKWQIKVGLAVPSYYAQRMDLAFWLKLSLLPNPSTSFDLRPAKSAPAICSRIQIAFHNLNCSGLARVLSAPVASGAGRDASPPLTPVYLLIAVLGSWLSLRPLGDIRRPRH